jgi:hypothetical protein
MKMKREKLTMDVFLLLLFLSGSLLAQQKEETSNVNLLNYDDVRSYLNLDIDQQKTIEQLIIDIIAIKEQDEKAIQEMLFKMQSMGMRNPSMREKIMTERAERQNNINGLIKQIEQSLNKEQLEKFNGIEKPNLMNKSKKMN